MELTRKENALLRALVTRGGRKRSGCCRCEGVRSVRELLQAYPERVKFVAGTERGFAALAIEISESRLVGEKEFAELADTVNSQGVIAVAEVPEFATGAIQGKFILALDQLGDPGNFGTIARTLRAVGDSELWYTKGSVDPWCDKAVRSGMGAQFGLRLRRFDTLEELGAEARKAGYANVFIADPHEGENCFQCAELFDHSVIVIGGEPNGVRGWCPDVRHIIIPMPGGFESLNAAQAATVLLFEAVRRQYAPQIHI